jgi:hypothetical protein
MRGYNALPRNHGATHCVCVRASAPPAAAARIPVGGMHRTAVQTTVRGGHLGDPGHKNKL